MTIRSRLEALEAQRKPEMKIFVGREGVYTRFNDDTRQMETFTREELEALYPDEEITLINVVYASMADVQSAQRGYLSAETPEELEHKAEELAPVGDVVKGYIGCSPNDWDTPKNKNE